MQGWLSETGWMGKCSQATLCALRNSAPAVKVTPPACRYNYNFRANINWLGETNGYLGQVTVDVQAARTAVNRPECSLNLQTPCIAPDGLLTATMPPVTALNFSVIDFTSFYQNYVGFPPTNAVRYSWPQKLTSNCGIKPAFIKMTFLREELGILSNLV